MHVAALVADYLEQSGKLANTKNFDASIFNSICPGISESAVRIAVLLRNEIYSAESEFPQLTFYTGCNRRRNLSNKRIQRARFT